MRKQIVIIGGVAVLSSLAFAAGIFVQRQYQLARIRAAEEFARDLVGLNDPIPRAPAWETWRYPNAKVKGDIHGSSTRISGELVRPAGRYAVLVTADEFEVVAKFYAEQLRFEDADQVAQSRMATSSHGTVSGESNHLLDDFEDASDPSKSRPVRLKCLIRRCPSYDVTVYISRAEGEAHTHVLLLYDPKTETQDIS